MMLYDMFHLVFVYIGLNCASLSVLLVFKAEQSYFRIVSWGCGRIMRIKSYCCTTSFKGHVLAKPIVVLVLQHSKIRALWNRAPVMMAVTETQKQSAMSFSISFHKKFDLRLGCLNQKFLWSVDGYSMAQGRKAGNSSTNCSVLFHIFINHCADHPSVSASLSLDIPCFLEYDLPCKQKPWRHNVQVKQQCPLLTCSGQVKNCNNLTCSYNNNWG